MKNINLIVWRAHRTGLASGGFTLSDQNDEFSVPVERADQGLARDNRQRISRLFRTCHNGVRVGIVLVLY